MQTIPKNQILSRNSIEQREHEDDAAARRVLLVDKEGNPVDDSNPLPVDVTVNINGATGTVKSFYNETLAVAIGATENLVTYTVPAGKVVYILKVDISGSNIATYDIFVNGSKIGRKRTYFGGDYSDTLEFGSSASEGLKLNVGDIVTVDVTNFRPSVGDFEARLQVVEV